MKDFTKRIEVNPKVMVGKPVIKGTRITVEEIVHRVAIGQTIKEIMEDFPRVSKEDIRAALLYAEKLVGGEEIFPIIKIKDNYEILGRRELRKEI